MPDRVQASHILLMYQGAPRSRATRSHGEARTEAAALAKKLGEGADFAEMARQHSDCPSARAGGNLGPFGKGQMVPAFEKAAFALDVGGVSDVVETEFGFHIIQRTA